jgi:hypothetical protein
MCDELLNEMLFTSLDHAREKIAAWTWDYTLVAWLQHSSLIKAFLPPPTSTLVAAQYS